VRIHEPKEALGVNSKADGCVVEELLKQRLEKSRLYK
jgi:hypothetical protein